MLLITAFVLGVVAGLALAVAGAVYLTGRLWD